MENLTGSFFVDEKLELLELESKKDDILRKEEESTRLKSRDLWIEAGDNNTKFFHRFASHRRNQNTIWDIKNVEGNKVLHKEILKKRLKSV